MYSCAWIVAALISTNPPISDAPVIPSLIAALHDRDLETRIYAGAALAALGDKAVPSLLEALSDQDRNARAGSAYALGQMGIEALPAKAKLLAALNDPEKDVRRQAAYALSRLLSVERDRLAPIPTAPEPVFPAEPTK